MNVLVFRDDERVIEILVQPPLALAMRGTNCAMATAWTGVNDRRHGSSLYALKESGELKLIAVALAALLLYYKSSDFPSDPTNPAATGRWRRQE